MIAGGEIWVIIDKDPMAPTGGGSPDILLGMDAAVASVLFMLTGYRDKGYITVTPDSRFLVSRRLKEDFDNGELCMHFNDRCIWMPGDPVSQPNREALAWHVEGVFLG